VIFEKDNATYMCRVIAKGGDEITIRNEGGIERNGSNISETDIFFQTYPDEDSIQYPLKLNENELFVLADYRQGGKDSRIFGTITKKDIKGKVITVLRRRDL